MRAPPPVVVELKTEPGWRAASAGLWAVAVTSVGAWLAPHWARGWSQGWRPAPDTDVAVWSWAMVLGLAFTVGSIVWRLSSSRPMKLAWTGRDWQLRSVEPGSLSAGPAWSAAVLRAIAPPCMLPSRGDAVEMGGFQTCAPQVVIDLGPWMLLRLGVSSTWKGPDWVAVSQRQAGCSWHGLRIALYCAPHGRPPTELR